jgi:tetratricopeptide (TPR) repeat protein
VTKTSEKAELVTPVLPPVTKTPDKPPEKVAVIPPVTPPETKTPPISTVPDTGVSERPTYESTPGDNGTPMRRGQEAMKVKDYGAAIQAFTQVIQNRPRFPEGYFDRGFAYEMSGHPDKAIQDYSDVIRMAPRHTRAWANRGICEARLHQDDAALADFNRALELDPNYPGALNGHGAILMRRHDLKGAIRDFSAAIKSNPKFELAYENRAKAKKAMKDDFGAADDLAVVQRLRQGK